MVENETLKMSGIMIIVDTSAKNIIYVKKIVFGTLPPVVVIMVNI